MERCAMNLIESLAMGIRHGEDRPSLFADERTVSYAQLAGQAGSLAAHLRRLGVRAGDRVALVVPTIPEYIVAYYGILGAGAVVVPINPRSRAPEIRYVLDDSGARAAIVHGSATDELGAAIADGPTLSPLVAIGEPALPGAIPLADLVRDPRPLDPAMAGDDDLAQLSYTSGTTGKPKGVMLTHRALTLNAEATGERLAIGQDDRVLAIAPLVHILGCTLVMNATLQFGAAAVFCAALDPDSLMATIQRHRCTVIGAVPTLYLLLLNHPTAYDLTSLRVALSGGAPTPTELVAAFPKRFGARIIDGYGTTEIGGTVSITPLDCPAKPGSVGLPARYVELAVLDEYDAPVATGELGELCLRGPTVMRGYWGQPEATAETLRGGWLHTGDLGYVDADGYCFIVDRKKDMIITSGFNVYPREVEEVLYQHPAVAEAGVVGMPDPLRGELVRACVTLRADAQATEAELIAFCKERLTPYKAPVRVEFLTALPKSPTGKLLRRELRDLLATRA
jgi:long-chain acyl-CoA synthetase